MNRSLIKLIDSDLLQYHKYKRNLSTIKKLGYFLTFFFIYPAFRAIFLYRISHYCLNNNKKKSYIFVEFFRIFLSPIEIESSTIIGQGIHFPHPYCIVIGGGKIGENVYIYQGVTIGVQRKGDDYATIGNNSLISAGVKILGNVSIGENSKIGANAVVITDIPENSVAVGIPARIIKK